MYTADSLVCQGFALIIISEAYTQDEIFSMIIGLISIHPLWMTWMTLNECS